MNTVPQAQTRFSKTLSHHQLTLHRQPLEILQVNLGRVCNQACHHCHVEAGPHRQESMSLKTVQRILDLLKHSPRIHTLDITGGAPELNPYFRKLVTAARDLNKTVLDRCNLTILFEPGHEDLAAFLKQNQVQIVASLPCYSQENVDKQRGSGVFNKSIQALKLLNQLGYGTETLKLDLVYNPGGAFLPPEQATLEHDYKERLKNDFGLVFNKLYTITNMPIKRFLHDLERQNRLKDYMQLLLDHFNPQAALGVMCRQLISLSWTGEIYDCDFNQMLEIPPTGPLKTIWDIQRFEDIQNQPITFADHCYGCTAGAGSSCGGSLVD